MKKFSKSFLILLTLTAICNMCLGVSDNMPMATIHIRIENPEAMLHDLFRNPFEIQMKTAIKEITNQDYSTTNQNRRLDTERRIQSEVAVALFNENRSKMNVTFVQAITDNLRVMFLIKCHAIGLLLWNILTSRAVSTLVRDHIPRLFDVQQ